VTITLEGLTQNLLFWPSSLLCGSIPTTDHILGLGENLIRNQLGASWQLLTNFPRLFARAAPGHSTSSSQCPDTSEGQGLWPKGGQDEILMSACRHVHGYSAPDIQLMLPYTDPRRASTSYNVAYIRLQCEVQGCASIIRIRTLMAFNKCLDEEATAMLAASQAHAIACGNGHSLNGPIVHKSLAFDVHLDEDWEPGRLESARSARLSA